MNEKIENTVKDWQQDNLAKNLAKESIETYGASVKDFLEFLYTKKITHIKSITEQTIKDYIVSQTINGLSARTINNRLKAIRRLFNFYNNKDKHYKPPKITLLKESESARSPLSQLDIERVISGINPLNKGSILTAFIMETGVRSKSARFVKVKDVDFINGLITFTQTKNRDILTIPISNGLKIILQEYVVENKLTGQSYLFPNNEGGQLYDRHSVYKVVKKYLKSVGVEKVGVHLFRYTFAKVAIQHNCNPMILQRFLGHKTMDETKKYVKLYSNDLKNTIEQITVLSNYEKK